MPQGRGEPMNDEAVLFLRWMKHRDADAFTQLAAQYAGLVYSTCRRVLGDASEVEKTFVGREKGRDVCARLSPASIAEAFLLLHSGRRPDLLRPALHGTTCRNVML